MKFLVRVDFKKAVLDRKDVYGPVWIDLLMDDVVHTDRRIGEYMCENTLLRNRHIELLAEYGVADPDGKGVTGLVDPIMDLAVRRSFDLASHARSPAWREHWIEWERMRIAGKLGPCPDTFEAEGSEATPNDVIRTLDAYAEWRKRFEDLAKEYKEESERCV